MNRWIATLVCTLALTASACASNGEPSGQKVARAESAQSGMLRMADQAAAPVEASERVIVRSGSIDVVVADPEVTAARLRARVEQLGGFVSDSTVGEESVFLAARVPSDQLDAFLDEVAEQGEVTSRSVSAQDMTEIASDLDAEIGNLVALRDRLRALLDKAAEVEEILKVERELTRVQTRLDSLVGRKQRIERDVALSAVHVSLAAEPEPRILGPLGLIYEGVKWFAIKLFVISP